MHINKVLLGYALAQALASMPKATPADAPAPTYKPKSTSFADQRLRDRTRKMEQKSRR